MSYFINGQSAVCPTGSITAYLGITDPLGWIICDGLLRTDNSDGRYNNLNKAGIGSGGSGTSNYTPPNFKGAFLRGIGTSSINNYVGPSAICVASPSVTTTTTFQDMGIFDHGHTITDPGHRHGYSQATNTMPQSGSQTQCLVLPYSSNASTDYSFTGITIGTTSVISSSSSKTIGETRPYNCGVNWIIKL
jgi:microcystin-dependent protein